MLLVGGVEAPIFKAGPGCDRTVTVHDLDFNTIQAVRDHPEIDVTKLTITPEPPDTVEFVLPSPSGKSCTGGPGRLGECR